MKRLLEGLAVNLSPPAVLACAAVLFVADWADQRTGSSVFPGGLLDEPAHFFTALLLLQALPVKRRRRIAVPALIGSVAIDLDHIPQYLGYRFLTDGTPRPYTHSLLTLAVILLIAVAVRRRRAVFLGLAVGVVLHFFRDLAEGSGGGISLFWPLSDHAYSYPHTAYLAVMACVVGVELLAGLFSRRSALLRSARRRPASRASV